MRKLPNRSVEVNLQGRQPPEYPGLLPFEEAVSFWLWLWPELLGWPEAITWIFSPVTGRHLYPGDLWGIDKKGQLIVVETKLDGKRSRSNPFEDFVAYESGTSRSECCRPTTLRERWGKLFKREKAFIANVAAQVYEGIRPTRAYPGVVPYSRRRVVVQHYPELYKLIADQLIRDNEYEETCKDRFGLLEGREEKAPIYFGVVGTLRSELQLSRKGKQAAVDLLKAAGSGRVHLRAIRPEPMGEMTRISSWSADLPEVEIAT
jgi:hypothetical protein